MASRSTENLDHLAEDRGNMPTPVEVTGVAVTETATIDLNYPDPTLLSTVLRDVSRWSGYSFVLEPRLNAKIQIFAPRRLRPKEAYEVFLASLSVLNLRAVQVGQVVKIVPITLIIAA